MKDSHRLQGKIVLNITKARFQYKPRIFFLFCDLDFMYYLVTLCGIHEKFLGTKFENHRWYSWNSVKKKLKLFGRPAGLEGRSGALRAPLRPSSPAGRPKSFNLFFYRVSWNHLWFQIFLPKNFRETTQSAQIIHETRSQQKKMRGFYLKPGNFYFLRTPWV